MPLIQNIGHRLANGSANQTRWRRLAVVEHRDGATGPPSLFSKRLAQRRQRRILTVRCKTKASWRLSCYFDLADGDVDVARLIAMSGSNVRSVNYHHHLGQRINLRFGLRHCRARALEISRDAMSSIAHG